MNQYTRDKVRIYIVEDEEHIRQELILLFNQYGYDVFYCEKFDKVVEDIINQQPDLILLDINLPYKDGYTLCREIRSNQDTPIIMLTGQDSALEEVMSLEAGADDFIGKPYHPKVLLAHIEAVLKRTSAQPVSNEIIVKGVSLDRSLAVLCFREKKVELTRNEFRILNQLMSNPDTIVSREEIMEELWQDGQFIDENTLNVNVGRLRKKLAGIGLDDFLKTKRGMGYCV